ncbi:hypothetical protein BDW22DRAFT_1131862 [Trametopsis cervina]|nr:hypothetical protein BDW22DRAFT_1131862 [Trametopsis cervina]
MNGRQARYREHILGHIGRACPTFISQSRATFAEHFQGILTIGAFGMSHLKRVRYCLYHCNGRPYAPRSNIKKYSILRKSRPTLFYSRMVLRATVDLLQTGEGFGALTDIVATIAMCLMLASARDGLAK